MSPLLGNILLALTWTALTGRLTGANFLMGFAVGYVALWMSPSRGHTRYGTRVARVLAFSIFFAKEIVSAGLRVAWDVVTPTLHMHPAVVKVPIDLPSDESVTLLANLISLTPGTLTLDVSEDRRSLYIHALYVRDVEAFRRSVKEGFERRVRDLVT